MLFKPMDEAAILKVLEGHEDVLTPMIRADQQVYESQSCPTCGSAMVVEPDIKRLLDNDTFIPKHFCRCPVCKHLLDPFSGITIEIGNKGLVEPAVPLIHKD
jgi:hypothetical protein